MLPFDKYNQYWPAVLRLPPQDHYTKAQLLRPEFLILRERGLDVYYAPFHYMNRSARIVLVGVTPGWTQMERAFWAAKQGLAEGSKGNALFSYIERTGSFSGSMRQNLVSMLDRIGIAEHLRIESCADLFVESSHLVHFTSVVSAPIFKNGANYAGSSPRLLDVPWLRDFVVENLAQELRALPNAVVIPLGKVPSEVIDFLHRERLVELDRCLTEFPHPSGLNGHRKPMFEKGQKRWQDQIRGWCA